MHADPKRYWRYFGVYFLWTAAGFATGISFTLLVSWLVGPNAWRWPLVLALPFLLAGFPASAIYGLRHGYAPGYLPHQVVEGPGHRWRNYLVFGVYALGILLFAWFVLSRDAT